MGLDEAYRDIYHFTLGGSLWDRRITTLDPCESSYHPPDQCLLTCRCAADTDEELFAEESEPEEGEQVETACKHVFSWGCVAHRGAVFARHFASLSATVCVSTSRRRRAAACGYLAALPGCGTKGGRIGSSWSWKAARSCGRRSTTPRL